MAAETEVLLGSNLSNVKRYLAFLSILSIYFFYCYNFMVGTFVTPTMIMQPAAGGFGFSLAQATAIFAIMSIGTIPGTLIFGMMSVKIGKKKTLFLISILFGLATYLPILSPSSYGLWLTSRCITGIALGGVYGACLPLVVEMFPQKYTGKISAIFESAFSVAMIFGGSLYAALGDANWRILLYSAIIPPVISAICLMLLCPDDKEYMQKTNKALQDSPKEKINYLSMYRGKYLLIGIGVILLSGANFVGYATFANNSTAYLTQGLGVTSAAAGMIFSAQGFGQLAGYNLWGYIADRFGRKKPAIGMILCGALMYVFLQLAPQDITYFQIIAVGLGLCIGFSGAWGAYYTELFPRRFSAISCGISFNGGRIISFWALPLLAMVADTSWGMKGMFYIAALVFVAGGILWSFLPETLNQPRED